MFFELSNHLGNVLATIRDKRVGVDINSNGYVDYYSHGGNVAIQAAKVIFEKTGQKVNIITIATPAYNKKVIRKILKPRKHILMII